MANEMLRLERVTKAFGGLVAVSDVSFSFSSGVIQGLIGPNGAGKSTLFNLVAGVYQVSSGNIYFEGRKITGYKPHNVFRLGIARTFQNLNIFKEMTVLDNVLVGQRARGSALSGILGLPGFVREDRTFCQEALETIEFVGLSKYTHQKAKNLPYGSLKLLEIGRCLASKPKLLLLDEPAAGLNDAETCRLIQKIREITELGITVLLVEHDMRVVMGLSHNVVVLDYGRKIADGEPEDIQRDPLVIEAYLGTGGEVNGSPSARSVC